MQKSTLYKNCQRQSCSAINCLSSGINILAGGSPVPLISERKGTDPRWKHVRCTHLASAWQLWRHCVTNLRSAHWLASSLKLAAHCPVSGCWPSCTVSVSPDLAVTSLMKFKENFFLSVFIIKANLSGDTEYAWHHVIQVLRVKYDPNCDFSILLQYSCFHWLYNFWWAGVYIMRV